MCTLFPGKCTEILLSVEKTENITILFKENKYYTNWIPLLHELHIMFKYSAANVHYLKSTNVKYHYFYDSA